MTEIISATYIKNNCTCYDCYYGENLLAVRIVPNDGYVLKRTFEQNGEMISNYKGGFVTLNIISINEYFPQYEAIRIEDVQEDEDIAGIISPEETV